MDLFATLAEPVEPGTYRFASISADCTCTYYCPNRGSVTHVYDSPTCPVDDHAQIAQGGTNAEG